MNLKEYFTKTRLLSFLLGITAITFWHIAENSPEFTEHFYARIFYPYLTNILAMIGSALPIPLTGLVYLSFILAYLFLPFIQIGKHKKSAIVSIVIHVILSLLALTSFLLFVITITFLLNHHRYSEEKLFDLDFNLNQSMINEINNHVIDRTNILSQKFPKDKRLCTDINYSLPKFDKLIEKEQNTFLESYNLPIIDTARSRYFLFSYVWGGLGVAGQYQPLFAQPNITKQLAEYSKPIVIAHERGHLNGFASEAGATLVAMQTLFHSEDNRLEYLAMLRLLLYKNNYKKFKDTINEQVLADIHCWNDDKKKMHRFRYKKYFTKANDTYLKMSGHKDGVKSYDRGTLLSMKYYYLHFVK